MSKPPQLREVLAKSPQGPITPCRFLRVRFVRLGALFGSVMLIVAVAVGYVARRADLAHSRDVQIEAAASIASANLGGFIKAVELSAALADDPEITMESLRDSFDGADVCIAPRADLTAPPVCTTDDAAFAQRATSMFGETTRNVEGIGSRLEITVVGEAAGVHATVDADDLAELGGVGVVGDSELDFLDLAEPPPLIATTIDGRARRGITDRARRRVVDRRLEQRDGSSVQRRAADDRDAVVACRALAGAGRDDHPGRAPQPGRAGQSRRPDPPAEPQRVRAQGRARAGGGATLRGRRLPAAVRPRRVQGDQRHVRSPSG